MWFQRAFIASRGSSVIAVAMDQDGRIDTIMNIFLTVKRNILEYCLENRRTDSKYIASILREVMRGVPKIILQLAPSSLLQNSTNAANFDCVRGAERPALRPARA